MMNRPFLIGLFAGAAAWLLAWKSKDPSRKMVSVEEAAAKLQQAWADHHTTA